MDEPRERRTCGANSTIVGGPKPGQGSAQRSSHAPRAVQPRQGQQACRARQARRVCANMLLYSQLYSHLCNQAARSPFPVPGAAALACAGAAAAATAPAAPAAAGLLAELRSQRGGGVQRGHHLPIHRRYVGKKVPSLAQTVSWSSQETAALSPDRTAVRRTGGRPGTLPCAARI